MVNQLQLQNNRYRNNDPRYGNPNTTATVMRSSDYEYNFVSHNDQLSKHRDNIRLHVPAPSLMNLQPATQYQSSMRRNRNDFEDDDGFRLVENNRNKRGRDQHDQYDNDLENNDNNRHFDRPQPQTLRPVNHRSPTYTNLQQSRTDTLHSTLHSNHQHTQPQQLTVSNESTRYAQSRQPFSPFVFHFTSGN
ncbi:unnamed protein product, partial [Rotaria sp. Silwood1]